ncbi:hypothetical protein C8R47DRAFT_6901 [Mycena vitilis]|nr:hypothetical protein C8R47DRAFT_6901 [Mycena vitilis]
MKKRLIARKPKSRGGQSTGNADSKARVNQLRDWAACKQQAARALPTRQRFWKFQPGLGYIELPNPYNDDRGFPLAPPGNDLRPWYTSKTSQPPDDAMDNRRKRDTATKLVHDPLTVMRQLASPPPSGPPKQLYRALPQPNLNHPPDVRTRLSRECSERLRALALIRQRRNEPPEICHKDDYGDLFNRQEVEEARRRREAQDRECHGRR